VSHVATRSGEGVVRGSGSEPPSLPPFDRKELLRLIGQLQEQIDRNPKLAVHPLTQTIIRLALTVKQGLGGSVEHLRLELAHRTAKRDTAREELTKAHDLRGKVAQTVTDSIYAKNKRIAELEEQLAEARAGDAPEPEAFEALRGELEAALEKLDAVQRVLDNPDAKVPTDSHAGRVKNVLRQLRERTTNLGASQERLGQLETEVAAARQDQKTASKARSEAEAKATEQAALVVSIRAVLQEYEYAGLSKQYTFRRTGKAIPCCQVCGGLDPDEVAKGTREAGHSKRCWYRKLLKKTL